MKAEIVVVGTELLLGEILDSNSKYLAGILNECGIDLYYISTVGDNRQRLSSVLTTALDRADLVITTGGLGPTMDDVTKEVVADIFGEELILHEESLAKIEQFFAKRHRVMSQNNTKQAMVPESAVVVPNPTGTAPGIILSKEGKTVICLPGVPMELKVMMNETVVPHLKKMSTSELTIRSRVLRTHSIGESALEEKLEELMEKQTNPTIALLAKSGEVHLRLTAKGEPDKVDGMLDRAEEAIRLRIGEFVYGYGEEGLEYMVGRLLKERNLTLGVAESCTGGFISGRITDVPGSSAYFDCGLVTYSNESKIKLLGVPEDVLSTYGAVSREVAIAMAEGFRKIYGVDIALSATGLAGPDGGSKEKPVGLVYIGLAAQGFSTYAEHRFASHRAGNRQSTVTVSLQLLYRFLTGQLEE